MIRLVVIGLKRWVFLKHIFEAHFEERPQKMAFFLYF